MIVFPFCYNIVLSLSDMSLTRFQGWRVIGLENYSDVLTDPTIGRIFAKTLIWTVVNVSFHVGFGVMLAVALNAPVPSLEIALSHLLHYPLGGAGLHHGPYLAWHVRLRIRRGELAAGKGLSSFLPLHGCSRTLHLSPPVNWLGEAPACV